MSVWILFGIIVLSVGADQLTKWLAVILLKGNESFPLWKDVFHLTYVENRGAAFGMLENARWVFMVFSTVAILALLVYLIGWKPKSRWVQTSLALIVGGGIGNMVDRTLLGYVVDFLDFTLIDFAVFNVADSCVTVGAGILMVYLIADLVRDWKKAKKAPLDGTVEESAEDPEKEDPEKEEDPASGENPTEPGTEREEP